MRHGLKSELANEPGDADARLHVLAWQERHRDGCSWWDVCRRGPKSVAIFRCYF